MAYHIFNSVEEAADMNAASLDTRWPERTQIVADIGDLLGCARADNLCVVEVCCGAGFLAENLMGRLPIQHYTGIDVSGPSLALAHTDRRIRRERFISRSRPERRRMVSRAGLYTGCDRRPPVRPRSGRRSRSPAHLRIGGLTACARRHPDDADLLPQPDDEPGRYRGRFSQARHVAMLADAGFDAATCTLQYERFGCFQAQTSTE